MTDPDATPDGLPRETWLLLAVGLFAVLCLLAAGVYHWWQHAHLRPLD